LSCCASLDRVPQLILISRAVAFGNEQTKEVPVYQFRWGVANEAGERRTAAAESSIQITAEDGLP
jgi:hypothetical protein